MTFQTSLIIFIAAIVSVILTTVFRKNLGRAFLPSVIISAVIALAALIYMLLTIILVGGVD